MAYKFVSGGYEPIESLPQQQIQEQPQPQITAPQPQITAPQQQIAGSEDSAEPQSFLDQYKGMRSGFDDLSESLGRNVLRTGASVLEEGAGIPRSIGEFGQAALNIPLGYATGTSKPLGESIPFLPTAKTVQDYITEPLAKVLTGKDDYLKPQSDAEEKLDEVIRTAVPFLLGGGKKTLAQKALRGLGISSVGNLSKWGAKKVGVSEGGQEAIKLGTMLATSMMGTKSARKYASELYKSAESIPDSTMVSYRPIKKSVDAMEKATRYGFKHLKIDSKEFLDEARRDIRAAIKPNKESIGVKDLIAFKKGYNEKFGKGQVPKQAQAYMGKFFKSFPDAYETAPESVQPALKSLKIADDIWASTSTYAKMYKLIKNNKAISAVGTLAGGKKLLTLLGGPKGTIGAIGAVKMFDFVKDIARHPGMRNYYANMMKSLIKEDGAAALKSANKLYKELSKPNVKEQKETKKNSTIATPKTPKYTIISGGYDK